ncbi:CDP-alcohol phosphatidyltransferase family protein [Roseibium litorale]|uniref:CDP-alcohol phosphatidyltransferase family protein n=1 Tax=Roseibium litorale TaxID=2803841 RepID=A0ABR9CQP9_9HYPH|nr:CDP-alcohol phosphatidyltransferase family protein [Roseibium litorale]MBD8893150.1 CDP-alcohol phosphatidyltransferase family protein [Roseibium litorale]
MFDARLRPVIDPPLNRAGRELARLGIPANGITLGGFVVGLAAAGMIAGGLFLAGGLLICLNRLADGLDGAVARASRKTDLGGYLDITLDFFFYGSIPLAFAWSDPAANALAATALLASFYANGSAFLAFAIMAERKGVSTDRQGAKSLYYLAGIAEGFETILMFLLMCVFPEIFPWLAFAFAALCGVSAAARVLLVARILAK